MKKTEPNFPLKIHAPMPESEHTLDRNDQPPRVSAKGLLFWLLLFLPVVSINSQAEVGTASFYGAGEKLNKHTANGDVFYPSHLTAASYQYYKKYVRVKSLRTGKEITVFVNDKGPAKRLNRLIDLSREAFRLLEGSLDSGLAQVEVSHV